MTTIEERFNEICEFVNWDKNNLDINFNETKAQLMQKYSMTEVLAVKDLTYEFKRNLKSVIDTIDANNLSYSIGNGDSASDLIYHIISLGTAGMQEYLDQPDLILKKFVNREYVESFAGCIPMKSDYEMVTKEYYQKFAQDIRNILADLSIFSKIFKRNKIILARKVLNEFEQGIFKSEYNYEYLRNLFSEIKIGVWMANMWDEGHIFYGLKIKQ